MTKNEVASFDRVRNPYPNPFPISRTIIGKQGRGLSLL